MSDAGGPIGPMPPSPEEGEPPPSAPHDTPVARSPMAPEWWQPGLSVPPGWAPPPGSLRSRTPLRVHGGHPLPIRAMSLGETLDASIKLYRSAWRPFIGTSAAILVPLIFLESYLTRSNLIGLRSADLFAQRTPNGTATFVSLAFTALQLVFVAPFLTALFAKLTSDMYVGAPSDVRTAYRFAVMRIGPILLVTILTGLAVLGGVLLLIVPAFLFYVRFAFASAVVVIEDEHGRGAMRRSWRLARGRFWPLFGTLLLASVLAGIVAGVATVPLTFAAEYIGPSGWPLAAVGSALAAIVTRPFVIVVTVLLYFDLRIRKEGFDLDVQVEQLRLER